MPSAEPTFGALTRHSLLRVLASSFVVVGGVSLVVELGVYGCFLIPRYGSLEAIPRSGLVGMYLPVLIACLAVAVRLGTLREALVAGLGAGAAASLGKWALALAGAPGHTSSLAAIDPARFVVLAARMTFGFVVVMAVGMGLGSLWRRRSRA